MRWVSGTPNRSGLRKYQHLVRAPGDPEATRNQARAGARDPRALWRKRMAEKSPEEWEALVLLTLFDGGPMSFHRLCVAAIDRDGDRCTQTPIEAALFSLLAKGRIQQTLRTPFRYRFRRPD